MVTVTMTMFACVKDILATRSDILFEAVLISLMIVIKVLHVVIKVNQREEKKESQETLGVTAR